MANNPLTARPLEEMFTTFEIILTSLSYINGNVSNSGMVKCYSSWVATQKPNPEEVFLYHIMHLTRGGQN